MSPRIDTYFFKIHSNIVLPSTLGLPKGLVPVGEPVYNCQYEELGIPTQDGDFWRALVKAPLNPGVP